MDTIVFLTGVAALLIHELDAIQQQEWRFFLGWTSVDDQNAYRLFTAAHFPLFVLILALLPEPGFQITLDLFLIGHALAHFLQRNHPLIHFNSMFSQVWIYGGAAAAFVHLIMVAG